MRGTSEGGLITVGAGVTADCIQSEAGEACTYTQLGDKMFTESGAG